MPRRSSDRSRIFVSVAAFCDPMLAFTVRSAVAAARHPDRLAFGVVDQSPAPVEAHLPTGAGRIAYLRVDPHQSRGACWARALAMSLYAGEDCFLQVDSHTAFDSGWDVALTDALAAISDRTGNARTVLSTRPFAFDIGEDGAVRVNRFTGNTLTLRPKATTLRLSDPVMAFGCHDSGTTDDLPGVQVSAAYLFAPGSFVEEVPYDPYLYFHGEEQNLSIRAFTRGWDIWHPNATPLHHLYKTRAEGEAPLHWDPQFEQRRAEAWTDLRGRAHRRLADLIAGQLSGAWGLGAARSIDDYLRASGLTLDGAAPLAPSTRAGGAPGVPARAAAEAGLPRRLAITHGRPHP
ncbi:GlcNAc-transferase family protein [Methylopila musalis]|uniref:GlcNAc-transferase family protein n=1 Tax=Methylopila musalis TaxID=1134781 RepID=A0ABW3Z376_9HYPH